MQLFLFCYQFKTRSPANLIMLQDVAETKHYPIIHSHNAISHSAL